MTAIAGSSRVGQRDGTSHADRGRRRVSRLDAAAQREHVGDERLADRVDAVVAHGLRALVPGARARAGCRRSTPAAGARAAARRAGRCRRRSCVSTVLTEQHALDEVRRHGQELHHAPCADATRRRGSGSPTPSTPARERAAGRPRSSADQRSIEARTSSRDSAGSGRSRRDVDAAAPVGTRSRVPISRKPRGSRRLSRASDDDRRPVPLRDRRQAVAGADDVRPGADVVRRTGSGRAAAAGATAVPRKPQPRSDRAYARPGPGGSRGRAQRRSSGNAPAIVGEALAGAGRHGTAQPACRSRPARPGAPARRSWPGRRSRRRRARAHAGTTLTAAAVPAVKAPVGSSEQNPRALEQELQHRDVEADCALRAGSRRPSNGRPSGPSAVARPLPRAPVDREPLSSLEEPHRRDRPRPGDAVDPAACRRRVRAGATCRPAICGFSRARDPCTRCEGRGPRRPPLAVRLPVTNHWVSRAGPAVPSLLVGRARRPGSSTSAGSRGSARSQDPAPSPPRRDP